MVASFVWQFSSTISAGIPMSLSVLLTGNHFTKDDIQESIKTHLLHSISE